MKVITICASVGVLLLAGAAVLADGCYMPRREDWKELRERSYINEPEQKALVYWERGVEDLIISPSYRGSATDFAWVVPVPSRPKVEILGGAPFHELAKLALPAPPRHQFANDIPRKALPASGGVRVLEEKSVGAYRIAVLAANDGQALIKWLDTNGYHLPEPAAAPVRQYIREGWTFVASRIKDSKSGAGLRTGTLAPLRLTFKAADPVYPMRLSSANPEPFKTLIYLGFAPDAMSGKVQVVYPTQEPAGGGIQAARRIAFLPGARPEYPTLGKLKPNGMQIFVRDTGLIHPQNCTKDYVWRITPQNAGTRGSLNRWDGPKRSSRRPNDHRFS